MLIVEPVIMRPWLTEWETARAEITVNLDKAMAATSAATRTRRRREAERLLGDFLTRLRAFTILDPACGSGNFLYLALHALKDLELGCSWRPRQWAFLAGSCSRPSQRQRDRNQPICR